MSTQMNHRFINQRVPRRTSHQVTSQRALKRINLQPTNQRVLKRVDPQATVLNQKAQRSHQVKVVKAQRNHQAAKEEPDHEKHTY